jgi:hypothetical protein
MTVFMNRAQRISGLKREQVAGGWRRQHNEEVQNLYSSLNIIAMNKPRRTRWYGHVVTMDVKCI